MFNAMLTGHLTAYRKETVDAIGGFRGEYDFSQDYDLALRMSEVARNIVHIERLLYLWRAIPGSAASGGKDYARETNIAALDDALRRRGIPGRAVPLSHANYVHITAPLSAEKVSIIIPSDSWDNLKLVIPSIREGTDHSNYEVVVVCNGPLADRLAKEFEGWDDLVFVKYDKKYNFSDKCNEGARAANGGIVVFYNDDVFPMQRDWIDRLIEYLHVPGVGGVSPKLLHGNDTIQYAGMISGTPGLCGTAYNGVPGNQLDGGFLTMHRYVRNVSLLSGACCAFRRDVFWAVGAFDPINTPDGHSDMDLSYKLQAAGYRCVYTPYALLRHIGNHSWGGKKYKYKADIYALRRWGKYVCKDPYFTDSMKIALYHDFRFNYRIYAEHYDSQAPAPKFDVLLVSHELSLTGAPRMLFYAAQVIQKAGGLPVVIAPADGPLRKELVQAGIIVIIDESIRQNHFLFEGFARNFDLAIVNTIDLIEAVKQLSRVDILKTVWWLHEAKLLSSRWTDVRDVSWERVRVLCVSRYAAGFLPEGIPCAVLHNGIPDNAVSGISSHGDGCLRFVMVGTIEHRKAQDVLVSAIELLPGDVRERCRFVLMGKLWDSNQEYWLPLKERVARFPEVSYSGLLTHEESLKAMAQSDAIICPSRDDPFPLVVMEAAMMSKAAIVSTCVGVREVFDERSCYTFESENAHSLAQQICDAVSNRELLRQKGLEARKVYERELSLDVFGKHFLDLVADQVA